MDQGGDDDDPKLMTLGELTSLEANLTPIITFNEHFDTILGGGVYLGKITEIHGDKGTGKTSLCCQLAINVQIPPCFGGLGAECLFIDTENTLVFDRIKTMAWSCANHCKSLDSSSVLTTTELLKGIHYLACGSIEELQQIIQHLPNFLRTNYIKLVVIDSVAFLFYGQSTQEYVYRRQILYQLFNSLHQLAADRQLAIVVTNNLTTRFSLASGADRVPFLGDIFHHVPNTRVELVSNGEVRSARVVKGTNIGQSASFSISSDGIRE